ncbi:MAG: hypothetical protein U0263_12970 [Polyangiaceae bacterium]
MKKTRVTAVAALLLGGGMLSVGGCDKVKDAQSAVCCEEFQVGGTITADISGSAEGQVAAQAVADFAGIASAAVNDITAACRSMAQDLDTDKATQDAAEAKADKREKMKAWCTAAVTAIGSFKAKAGGTLTVSVTPPKCEASISAKANCQAKCSASGQCDIKATPPTCEGGKLEVACKGECTAKAGATLSCEGECTGECTGSCTAEGGVECDGKCEGTCEASAGGSGPQANGSCKGTCKGTCSATAPKATCTGSCKGTCSASCKGSATASVKCDGECSADYEPLKCTGGELKGGCQVEAKCDANCDASVKAKAECRPPEIAITFSGAADVQAVGKLQATLKANLGVVYAFKARLEGMATIAAQLSGNVDAVADIKAACIPAIIAAAGDAASDVTDSVQVSGSIVGSVSTN